MKWSATFPVSWSLSFSPKSLPLSNARSFLRRARYHLLYNLIPTLLILIIVSWVTLLITEQLCQSKTRPKISFAELYADR